MNEIHQNTGFLKSPKDPRDFTIKKVKGLLGAEPTIFPQTYFTDISSVPVLFQGKQSSCIGHATASGMMALDGGKYSYDYSPRFIYALCKRDDGYPNADGTFYKQAMAEGKNNGICDNAQFPNDINLPFPQYKDASLIPQQAFDTAKQRTIKSYVKLNNLSFEGIKAAIYESKIVLLGVEIGIEFYTPSWQAKDVLPLRSPQKIVSGHALLCYGYDENYIYFRNSFGPSWGDNGNGYFCPDYLPFCVEGWVFMDLAPDVIENLKQQVSILQQVLYWFQKLWQNLIKN